MQTLRKRNSPCKFKNEPTRFLGEGVSFKAKLIGILEVSEARGDRMCQAALADLKMAIRAAGEHKQRIAVQVSIDGLRLRDEKTGDCLYHHPVHKISFIAQDMSDSRAFGYIFGSPDTGHRFFGIKTDKAASQVVIAMRDLFQVVFELKKKEIELAKQHIEQNAIKFHTSGIFVEPAPDTKGAAGSEISLHRTRTANTEVEKSAERKHESQSGVIADLLDLQFELNSLQQGIHQMDKITPDNPMPPDDLFETDPFGDSFANMKLSKETVQPILPPPPPSSSKRGHLERQQTVPATPASATSSPATISASKTPPPQGSIHWFDRETESLFSDGELSNISKSVASKTEVQQEDISSQASAPLSLRKSPQIDVFTELDPLGTGLIKPYVDKKDFFQHLKNPPKKVLKDLVSTNSTDTFPTNFNITAEISECQKIQNDITKETEQTKETNFADFDKFEETETTVNKTDRRSSTHHQPLSVSLPPEDTPLTSKTSTYTPSGTISTIAKAEKENTEALPNLVKLPSPKKYLQRKREFDIDLPPSKLQSEKSFPVDFSATSESPASPLRSCSSDANSRLSSSSAELDLVPEPPPRGAGSILINPPPLPPKKQSNRGTIKPPPRPPYTEGHFHYDFLEREETSPSPTRKERTRSPLSKESKSQFDDNFSPPQLPQRSPMIMSSFEDSFGNFSSFLGDGESKKAKPSLDITLSQLTSTNLAELAGSLGMTISELTSLPLQQLIECLASLSTKESQETEKKCDLRGKTQVCTTTVVETSFVSSEPLFKTNFDQEEKKDPAYDKYAVFRELFEMEQMKQEGKAEEQPVEEDEGLEMEVNQMEEDANSESQSHTESLASLVNLTVKLPPTSEDLAKLDNEVEGKDLENEEQQVEKIEEAEDVSSSPVKETEALEGKSEGEVEEQAEDKAESDTIDNEDNVAEEEAEENAKPAEDDKPSANDKYAALREIITETVVSMENEEAEEELDEEATKSISPVPAKPEVELMNLFTDSLEASSPKKGKKDNEEVDLKAVAMDIFEEIKMLNTGCHQTKETKSGFEDVFCPFTEGRKDSDKEEPKDDGNWAKFDSNVFHSDRSSCEGPGSVGGTSPWSPDGKEFHKESVTFKANRNSGDSDNEWKDEEESEESNGKRDGTFWSRHPRYEAVFDERNFYEETSMPTDKRERGFRDRLNRKTRGAAWPSHRSRDPSPWHEDSRWEEEPRRYPAHRKLHEEEFTHWKCRPKPRTWNGERDSFWAHPSFYEEERGKRKMMLWNEEERFSSQDSMGYDDEERWSRREYERRRWEEDGRFWNRRPDGDYPREQAYPRKHDPHYYRDRPHDYPPGWEEEAMYPPERADESPRYPNRKRHWPKRPSSANDGRDTEIYGDPRVKYGVSRSECSDNDSDPYLRPSNRSRSRESYWGSDQEYEGWGERPYWSEGPDAKSETLHRRRGGRHKVRPTKSSPFEDDFTQTADHSEASAEPVPELRARTEDAKPPSPRAARKEHRRDPRSYKRSSYFEDDLTPTASASSDASDRQRLSSDLKATPEEMPADTKDPNAPIDGFVSEDSGRDSFFNGDLRFDEDAFAFKSELEDNVPERATTLPLKNTRQGKYTNNNKTRSDQYIRKSESVNIFARENDPFDDDDFFN